MAAIEDISLGAPSTRVDGLVSSVVLIVMRFIHSDTTFICLIANNVNGDPVLSPIMLRGDKIQ
jgi:hypothetical protein